MLKAVPKRVEIAYGLGNLTEDPRYWFFLIPTSKKKFYYRRNGDKLEKLGRYTDLTITSNPRIGEKIVKYIIYFDKTPERWFHAQMDDDLYYSDEPLSDSELDYSNNPDIKSIINGYGGRRKTKRYRKPKKSRKSRKSRKSKKSRKN